jgi:hypothetical protein
MIYTEEAIYRLRRGEVFVFGSNESGVHGAGAARQALEFGAIYGQGFGMAGHTFAIPTKDWKIEKLSLEIIKFYVDRFYDFAQSYPEYHYLVTRIGCGLAGYSVKQIAPLFKNFVNLKNISLPKNFVDTYESDSIL